MSQPGSRSTVWLGYNDSTWVQLCSGEKALPASMCNVCTENKSHTVGDVSYLRDLFIYTGAWLEGDVKSMFWLRISSDFCSTFYLQSNKSLDQPIPSPVPLKCVSLQFHANKALSPLSVIFSTAILFGTLYTVSIFSMAIILQWCIMLTMNGSLFYDGN